MWLEASSEPGSASTASTDPSRKIFDILIGFSLLFEFRVIEKADPAFRSLPESKETTPVRVARLPAESACNTSKCRKVL